MGTYKEQGGKAPQGLTQGDYVVTGGGTYLIGGVGSGEGYTYKDANGNMRQVTMYNPNQTTYNYKGSYDTVPNISTAQAVAQATSPATAATGQTKQTSYQSGAVNPNGTTNVTNKGQGQLTYDNGSGRLVRTMPNGSAWYVDPTDAKYAELYQEYYNGTGQDPRGLYSGTAASGAGMMQSAAGSMDPFIQAAMGYGNAIANMQTPTYQAPDTSAQKAMLDQYLAQLGSIEYNPVDYDQYMSRAGTLDEYYQQAMDVLNPRYQSQYRDVYNKSANNLGKAGIFNSLAAQALMAQQQNAVTEALNADAAEMGQNLYQKALDRAYQAYQAAVQENQFGASFKQQNLTESGQLTMNYIGLLNDEAAAVNDYNMQAYLGKMQQYTAAIDAAYKAGSLTSAEYENMMNAAKIELSKVEQQLTQAQIANTEADTEYTKAKTQATLWEMANPTNASGYGSGYGYGYGGGGEDDIVIDVVEDDGKWKRTQTPRDTTSTSVPPATVIKDINTALANGDTQSAGAILYDNGKSLNDGQYASMLDKIKNVEAAAARAKIDASLRSTSPTGGGFH